MLNVNGRFNVERELQRQQKREKKIYLTKIKLRNLIKLKSGNE